MLEICLGIFIWTFRSLCSRIYCFQIGRWLKKPNLRTRYLKFGSSRSAMNTSLHPPKKRTVICQSKSSRNYGIKWMHVAEYILQTLPGWTNWWLWAGYCWGKPQCQVWQCASSTVPTILFAEQHISALVQTISRLKLWQRRWKKVSFQLDHNGVRTGQYLHRSTGWASSEEIASVHHFPISVRHYRLYLDNHFCSGDCVQNHRRWLRYGARLLFERPLEPTGFLRRSSQCRNSFRWPVSNSKSIAHCSKFPYLTLDSLLSRCSTYFCWFDSWLSPYGGRSSFDLFGSDPFLYLCRQHFWWKILPVQWQQCWWIVRVQRRISKLFRRRSNVAGYSYSKSLV